MGKRTIYLLLIATLLFSYDCVAQESISRDDIRVNAISYTNDAFAEASAMGAVALPSTPVNVGIPSVDNENFLQIGTSLPSLVQTMLFGLGYGVDTETVHVYPRNFSQELAESRYYWGDEWMVSAINLEYGRKVNDWLALGLKGYLGFSTRPRRHVVTKETIYHNTMWATAAIFNVRFDWLRRDIVTMYSSIGAGVAVLKENDFNEVIPMFDFTAVGLSLGRRFYGYVELGSGASGGLRAGVGVRF